METCCCHRSRVCAASVERLAFQRASSGPPHLVLEAWKAPVGSVQSENCEDCSVDAPSFLGAEMARYVSEATDVDGADLFDQDFGLGALHFHSGSKGQPVFRTWTSA